MGNKHNVVGVWFCIEEAWYNITKVWFWNQCYISTHKYGKGHVLQWGAQFHTTQAQFLSHKGLILCGRGGLSNPSRYRLIIVTIWVCICAYLSGWVMALYFICAYLCISLASLAGGRWHFTLHTRQYTNVHWKVSWLGPSEFVVGWFFFFNWSDIWYPLWSKRFIHGFPDDV